jgi:hypothetical protein
VLEVVKEAFEALTMDVLPKLPLELESPSCLLSYPLP